jgi:hypothetical protein
MLKNYKTRRNKLKNNLIYELNKTNPCLESILNHIDEYEKNNLLAIKKLKRKKVLTLKRINGALKQTIHAHGPITLNYISSASKRIYGNLLNVEKKSIYKRFLLWIKKLLKNY